MDTAADFLAVEFLRDLKGSFEYCTAEKGERQSAGDTGLNFSLFFVRKIQT